MEAVSLSVSLIRSDTSSAEESKLTTRALSRLVRITLSINWLAASCSNLKRSRTLLLVVDEDAQAEGQVGFRGEVRDGLPPLAFDDFKIVLGEVGDEAALLVGDGKEQADACNVDLNTGGLIALNDLASGPGGVLAGDRNGDGDRACGREWRPNSHMVRL